MTLENPSHPWSHVALDFLTDLPELKGHTTIMVVIGRFSRFLNVIPLTGLPTAYKTAELIFNHVFRNDGIPEDIVRPTIHLSCLEGIHETIGGYSEPSIRLPFPVGQSVWLSIKNQREMSECKKTQLMFCHAYILG